MALIPDEAQSALVYWGVIQRATAAGATTAQLWGAIREQQAELGLPSTMTTLQAVNTLRAYGTRLMRTSQALGAADPSAPLTSDYIGAMPWSARDAATQATAPDYIATFAHTVIRDGQQVTEYRTVHIAGADLPGTVGELADLIDGAAEDMAGEYGVGNVSVSQVSLARV